MKCKYRYRQAGCECDRAGDPQRTGQWLYRLGNERLKLEAVLLRSPAGKERKGCGSSNEDQADQPSSGNPVYTEYNARD